MRTTVRQRLTRLGTVALAPLMWVLVPWLLLVSILDRTAGGPGDAEKEMRRPLPLRWSEAIFRGTGTGHLP